MKKNSLHLLNKINPLTVEILELISNITIGLNVPFFIVGATARDIFFEQLHNIKTSRSTLDLDLGIHIAAWESYHLLMNRLLQTGKFTKSNILHRIYYTKDNYPIDIVPFGVISGENEIITWPDKQQMSTSGFKAAYQDCYEIKISVNPDRVIPVASPVGLVVMKLISWNESKDRAQKDAQDIGLIFSNYHSLFQNKEKIFDFPEILDMVQYDIQRAGTVLLGKDTASILKDRNTRITIESILDRETSESATSKLAIDMMNRFSLDENEFDRKLQMLNDFKAGVDLYKS